MDNLNERLGLLCRSTAVPVLFLGDFFMQIQAYAKINLALDIIGKRADGYHLLDMAMHTISLCDILTLERERLGLEVACGRADVPCGEENTVYRAAKVFFERIGKAPDVSIAIRKQIPSQAGLAGGSADAAAALHALNRLYHAGLPVDELCKIGLTVGADVPFCVRGGSARVQGIGEVLQAAPLLPECRLVVCKPQIGVDTKAAYRAADTRGGCSGAAHTPAVLDALAKGSLSEIAGALGNAFEDILCLPEVETIREQMRLNGALGACMTGSGSAVYGLFDDAVSAAACWQQLRLPYPETFLCEPVDVPCAFLE